MTKSNSSSGSNKPAGSFRAACQDVAEQWARLVWEDAPVAVGTCAEKFLATIGMAHDVPAQLRFIPPSSEMDSDAFVGSMSNTLVCPAFNRAGEIVGVHRTAVDHEGRGTSKDFLGTEIGSTFRFGPPRPELLITSSLEEAIALRLLYPDEMVWAVFSPEFLPLIDLPADVKHVTFCVGRDPVVIELAHDAMVTCEVQLVDSDVYHPTGGFDTFAELWLMVRSGLFSR